MNPACMTHARPGRMRSTRLTVSRRPACLVQSARPAGHFAARATYTAADLSTAVQDLTATCEDMSDEDIDAKVAHIQEMAEAVGANKVIPELLEGYFKAAVISGVVRQKATDDGNLTLGALSGFALQPAGLKVSFNKVGRRRSTTRVMMDGRLTHILPTSFYLQEYPQVWGKCDVLMDLEANRPGDPEASRRTWMTRREVVVTPDFSGGSKEELLPLWLEHVGNPAAAGGASLDPETGVVRAAMAEVSPPTSMDVLAATPEWGLYVGGKTGSRILYSKVDGPYYD